MSEKQARLAVLIDADNMPARYAQAIFAEIARLGLEQPEVRRIYGDFSSGRLKGWDDAIEALAIVQHQQRSNSVGKNSTDIALVIDAMDLAHAGWLDGFCLVSSDSDFTRLAQRLREGGLSVYGFGERNKTAKSLPGACRRFVYVENLPCVPAGAEPGKGAASIMGAKEPPSKAVPIIARAIEDGTEGDWVSLNVVGLRIRAEASDFDPRTYGCAKLSTLVEKSGGFELRKRSAGDGATIHIRRKSAA